MNTLTITAHTPLKFLGAELFLGWITMPFGPERGVKKPHFSDRETFIVEAGKSVASLMIAPLTIISMEGSNAPQSYPWLRADDRGRLQLDADALIAENVLPIDIPGLMKIEMETHSRPEVMSGVYEYVSMNEMEAEARNYVNFTAALSNHPEIVALREAQMAADIYGKDEGLAAMREAYARLQKEQK